MFGVPLGLFVVAYLVIGLVVSYAIGLATRMYNSVAEFFASILFWPLVVGFFAVRGAVGLLHTLSNSWYNR